MPSRPKIHDGEGPRGTKPGQVRPAPSSATRRRGPLELRPTAYGLRLYGPNGAGVAASRGGPYGSNGASVAPTAQRAGPGLVNYRNDELRSPARTDPLGGAHPDETTTTAAQPE